MPRTRTSFKPVISWILQIVLALLFAVQGLVKVMGSPNWVARFNRWGYPPHFYLAVGVAELVGAVLLLIPRLAKFGALLLSVVMIGAAGTHLLHHEPQVMTTLVLLCSGRCYTFVSGGDEGTPYLSLRKIATTEAAS